MLELQAEKLEEMETQVGNIAEVKQFNEDFELHWLKRPGRDLLFVWGNKLLIE